MTFAYFAYFPPRLRSSLMSSSNRLQTTSETEDKEEMKRDEEMMKTRGVNLNYQARETGRSPSFHCPSAVFINTKLRRKEHAKKQPTKIFKKKRDKLLIIFSQRFYAWTLSRPRPRFSSLHASLFTAKLYYISINSTPQHNIMYSSNVPLSRAICCADDSFWNIQNQVKNI